MWVSCLIFSLLSYGDQLLDKCGIVEGRGGAECVRVCVCACEDLLVQGLVCSLHLILSRADVPGELQAF